ncbi:SDR family oxidoreductase [Candidatus Omnitrophota bacterium]
MRLLIIGASGALGSRLYSDAIKKKWDVLGTYYSYECEELIYLDLEDKKSIDKVFDFFKPEVVLLAGGLTNVDLCEENPALAEKVNISGTLYVAKKTKEHNARLVYVSTDYIFNGENGPYHEDDIPSPINVYGRTKLEAENIIRANLEDYLIVRTSQLYGGDDQKKNFAVKIVLNMRNNKKIYAADDFYSTPIYAGSLSQSIIELIERSYRGVLNIAGEDFINRYSYVNRIADIFNLEKSLINKVALNDLHLKAMRPPKGGLKIDKVRKIMNSSLMTMREGLTLFKAEQAETKAG